MRAAIKRLPCKLKDKLRTVACDIQERHLFFFERLVKITTDPVFERLYFKREIKQKRWSHFDKVVSVLPRWTHIGVMHFAG